MRAGRDLVDLVDEDRASPLESLDHMAVVHDLLPDVHGRSVDIERTLDDLHGAVDPRTPAAWSSEEEAFEGHKKRLQASA